MKNFRWNELKSVGPFWDYCSQEVQPYEVRSDKSIITNPAGVSFQAGLEALCRVVAELVEIEENKNNEDLAQ